MLQLARVSGVTSTKALTRWDDTRLSAYIEFTSRELTVTVINLSDTAVGVRDSGIVFGRRRPPKELVVTPAGEQVTPNSPTIGAGESLVCARVPVDVLRTVVSRFRLKPSRMRGRVTFDDGRVIVSKCLRITTR